MKLLLWGAIGFLIVMWLLRDKDGAAGTSENRSPKADQEGEPMIRCTHCGLYVPESESVAAHSGAAFCSEEHRHRHES